MHVPDPMTHDFGLGSDFSEASTPGGRAIRRTDRAIGDVRPSSKLDGRALVSAPLLSEAHARRHWAVPPGTPIPSGDPSRPGTAPAAAAIASAGVRASPSPAGAANRRSPTSQDLPIAPPTLPPRAPLADRPSGLIGLFGPMLIRPLPARPTPGPTAPASSSGHAAGPAGTGRHDTPPPPTPNAPGPPPGHPPTAPGEPAAGTTRTPPGAVRAPQERLDPPVGPVLVLLRQVTPAAPHAPSTRTAPPGSPGRSPGRAPPHPRTADDPPRSRSPTPGPPPGPAGPAAGRCP